MTHAIDVHSWIPTSDQIVALFVEQVGVYFNDPRIYPYDLEQNAFTYRGPNPVIAHPPCKRWGRYWSGGPSALVKRIKGDDSGAFAHSLWCVRTFGGVLEHPEASHAWDWFGLKRPDRFGGWSSADQYGGRTCCVEQGHYGHRARKATWLYLVGGQELPLIWGPSEGERLDAGFHTKEEAKVARSRADYVPRKRLSPKENLGTPKEFKEILIKLISPKEVS